MLCVYNQLETAIYIMHDLTYPSYMSFTAPLSQANPIGLEGLVTLTMGVIALILACIPRGADLKAAHNPINHGGDDENVPLRYNQAELAEYWSKRPIVVMQRSTEVITSLVGFTMAIIFDAKTGQWNKRMPERAAQLRKIVEGLGATCIKIAQVEGFSSEGGNLGRGDYPLYRRRD